MSRPPNIVLLLSDQHRADVMGCAGDPVVRTPCLDRLAAEGVRFANAFAQSPLCMPSRASLLTERYVRDHGVFENGAEVALTAPTFLHALRAADYRTVAIGKTHLWMHNRKDVGHADERKIQLNLYGFEEVHETVGKLAVHFMPSIYSDALAAEGALEAYRAFAGRRQKVHGAEHALAAWDTEPAPVPAHLYADTWLADYACRWLDEVGRERPFFLQVGFPGPHDPWDAPEDARRAYEGAGIPLPASLERPELPAAGPMATFLGAILRLIDSDTLTDERLREVRRAYFANVSLIDQGIGRIVEVLARRGLLDDTWVIYGSDHGEMLGEHRLLHKRVFYDPAVQVPLILRPPGGGEARTVDSLVQLIDLSATLREIAGAGDVPGSEAKSLLPLLQDDAARPLHEAVVSEACGFLMVRTGRHKLVVHEDDLAPGQLFDLERDPLENRNLVDDAASAPVLAELMGRYVRPFLATRPLRPHRTLVERHGRVVTGG